MCVGVSLLALTTEELLLDYASGALGPAASLVAHVYARGRDDARQAVENLEHVGGLLLDDAIPARLTSGAVARALSAVDTPEEDAPRAKAAINLHQQRACEATIVENLLNGAHHGRWRWVMPGMRRIDLPAHSDARGKASLVQFAAGRAVPTHAHHGLELTLVLQGSYADETGVYGCGDLAVADEDTEHRPRAVGEGPCICLVAAEGNLRIRNPLIELPRSLFG